MVGGKACKRYSSFCQETYQIETKTKQTQRQLKSWSLEGFYLPAEATGRGGTAGGQFVVAARTLVLASCSLGAMGSVATGWNRLDVQAGFVLLENR